MPHRQAAAVHVVVAYRAHSSFLSTATSLSEANIVIKGIPKLSWLGYGQVGAANVTADGALLTMVAGKHTAMFVSPDGSSIPPDWSGSSGYVPASALVFEAPSSGVDWQLSAKVTVPKFSYLFDSSCLFGYHGPYDWVNLCFEYSPEKVPEIVSVVTRGVSDDANGAVVEEGNSVYLRLSKFGDVMASHWSLDGKYWTLNRHFALQKPGEAMWIGFDVQAPTAESNTAIYSDIVFRKRTLLDLRDGS